MIVGTYSSTCSNCGKPCSWHTYTHDVILGYGSENGSPGCGITFTHITSSYFDNSGDVEEHLTSSRPDLEYIG